MEPQFPQDLPVMQLARISPALLESGDRAESQRLYDASVKDGFFLLDLRQGLDSSFLDKVDEAFAASKEFFAQDLEVKKQTELRPGNIGYKPQGTMKLPSGQTDLTEICAIARDDILDPAKHKAMPSFWVRHVALLAELSDTLHKLSVLVLSRLADHLDIERDALLTPHDPSEASSTVMRFLHNPPQHPGDTKHSSLAGHTDSGSLTLLFNRIGGLQVLPADALDEADSAWYWVKPEPGCLVVNIADVLVQWTGGVLRSAYHRVLHAPGEQAQEERYSFGYFLKPHFEADMSTIRQGSVVRYPEEKEAPQPPYREWQNKKLKYINSGTSVRSNGGLGPRTADVAASA